MIAALFSAILSAAFSFYFGGWEWRLICVATMVPLRGRLSWVSVLSLCWLGAFVATGDRRLFFPFTIQFAMQLACFGLDRSMLRAALGALWVVGVFSVVRLMQSASLIVLLVEVVVAAVAIAVSLEVYQRCWANRMVVAALASLLAFAGLVF